MSGRTLLSRPRTRVYDANYNIGESYYRPALDRLDRKYSGRPLSPPPRNSYFPRDVADRHERAFFDEDISAARKRAEKHITGADSFFDSRGARISARADFLENDIDEETAASLRRIRANKKVSIIDDVDLESTASNLKTRRMVDRSEKVLNSVGINDSSRKALNDDISYKRRSLRVTYDDDVSNKDLTRWKPLPEAREEESAASVRARASRARINDIDEEMAEMAEKQAARERRAARLKAFMAETAEENDAVNSALQSVQYSARREKQSLEF